MLRQLRVFKLDFRSKHSVFDSIRLILREYIEVLVVLFLVAFLVRQFVVSPFRVVDTSMAPGLRPGDYIWVYKLPYLHPFFHLSAQEKAVLSRGDIVVFTRDQRNGTPYIRRVVALPGDRVEMHQGHLLLNGQRASYFKPSPSHRAPYKSFIESWGQHQRAIQWRSLQALQDMEPQVVPPGHVFVLSDDRSDFSDSRQWGPIPASSIVGEARWIWLSLDLEDESLRVPKVRWGRFLSSVD